MASPDGTALLDDDPGPVDATRRRRVRVLAWLLALALAGLLVAVAVVTLGRPNVFDLARGDCFDDAPGAEPGGGEVSDVPVVPCDRAHDNEVFATLEVPGEAFPGAGSLRDLAVDACVERFRGAVGYPLALTDLDVSALWPTEASWADGDREVVCILARVDGGKLVGSRLDLAAQRGQEEFRLQEGDCFDAPLREPDAGQDVEGVAVVDCARPHFAEVYEVLTLDEGPYPGRDEVGEVAQQQCHAAFEPFVGEPFEDSAVLWFNALPPTEGSWEAGDRDVVCYVYDLVNGQIVGPAPAWAREQQAAAADFGGGYEVDFLEVGDCFDDPAGRPAAGEPAVDTLPCGEPHDNEVFEVLDLPDGDWPGRARLEQLVAERCGPAFEREVGPDRGDLAWFPFQPDAGTWARGDRRVVCALYDVDFLKLTGSQRRGAV